MGKASSTGRCGYVVRVLRYSVIRSPAVATAPEQIDHLIGGDGAAAAAVAQP